VNARLRSLALVLIVLLLASSVLACDLGGAAAKPTIVITAPTSNAQFEEGEEVNVLSSANDAKGITRVELLVDGELYRTDSSPSAEGEESLAMAQTWRATDPGMHTLSVIAYNVDGAASEPYAVTVEVVGGGGVIATATPPAQGAPPAATNTPPPPGATATTPPPPEATATTPPPPEDTPEPLPDLVLESVSINPTNPDWGESIEVAVDVGNYGTAPAGPHSIIFRYGSGDFDVCEWDHPSLNPGDGGTNRCTVEHVYVTFNTEATVDWRGAVDESNEDNNGRELAMAVGAAPPDLVVDGLSVNPSDPGWGESIQVAVGVINMGSTAAGPHSILFRYGSGDFDVCEWNQPSLPAGDGGTLRCTVDHVYVSFNTVATVDWRDQVEESNEDNNYRQLTIAVGPAP